MSAKMIIKNTGNVIRAIRRQVVEAEEISIEILKYAGESFVAAARDNREFRDDTGNLQSSIGYVIVKDRRIIWKAFKGIGKTTTSEGKASGERLAQAIALTIKDSLALVGVAGMEYGIYVEARGIDVISGSIPETRKIMSEIVKNLKK